MKGTFVVVEGGEGSGKSSALEFLKERTKTYLEKGLCKVFFTREPGGTMYAEEIRNVLLDKKRTSGEKIWTATEILLFSAARVQHVNNVIEPQLARGVTVVCDRFSLSTLAYQIYGRQESELIGIYKKIDRMLVNITPDVLIFFDVDPEIGLARRRAGGETDRFDDEKLDFHHRVRKGYLENAEVYAKQNFILDANRSEEDVQNEFRALMTDILKVTI